MHCVWSFVFTLLFSVVSGSQKCSEYDFPCENGECIDMGLWCDTHKDCSDGSDEKYCKIDSLNKDANKCSSSYFKCTNGPCIPMVGRCDGYNSCDDFSDEKNCNNLSFENEEVPYTEVMLDPNTASDPDTTNLSLKTAAPLLKTLATVSATKRYVSKLMTSTTKRTTIRPPKQEEPDSTRFLNSTDPLYSIRTVYSDLHSSDYIGQREKALNWLLSQRKGDFGWGDETPRAITALYLSDMQQYVKKLNERKLMMKQLEVHLSLSMARNATKAMQLTDLSLHINALLASCQDPKNFYGENLVQILRNSVDAAQETAFVNPSVYLTLCVNNASTYEDTRKLIFMFSSRNAAIGRIDIQALALLSATCIYRKTNHLTLSMYESVGRQFYHKINSTIFPGNVYEAAIVSQALQELKINLPGLFRFILNQQREDGSFGGVLATYLVLPVLSGRSFLQMNDHCSQRYTSDIAPIEVLKNPKRRKINVQYSLNYGNPEITQIVQMRVAEGINFLDVMRLAEEINPSYRFMLDDIHDVPVVYSIGGIPNDAEKSMFWTLHFVSNSSRVGRDAGRLSPFSGNLKQLIPQDGDEFVFRMKSL